MYSKINLKFLLKIKYNLNNLNHYNQMHYLKTQTTIKDLENTNLSFVFLVYKITRKLVFVFVFKNA